MKREEPKRDEVLEQLIRSQSENDLKRMAITLKDAYDNLLGVGFEKQMAERIILSLVSGKITGK